MKKHSFKEWLIAVRPWSFPASAMPVMVTLAYLFRTYHGHIDWVNGILALVGVIFFHAAGNTWSDYFDYKKGVDREDTFGVKTLTSGQFQPREIFRLSFIMLIPGIAIGIWLMYRAGWPLLWIGLGGVGCSLCYPWLKYRTGGDFVIFINYGVLTTLGTSFIARSAYLPEVLLIAVPVGLITVAILHANNTRDVLTDQRAGITTIAMRAGVKTNVFLYLFEIFFPFLWLIGCTLLGYIPAWTVVALLVLAVPMAVNNAADMLKLPREGVSAIANLDEKTAKLQLVFSLLFTLTLFIP
ncbi:MAG: prenyltransferase [Prevotellaceae bacterium]|jgi:1,4-dihydroxy-2-naphthoate octaprenyltransferase|nr:prenyltransferase [Prevotellaceae bacterium]